MKSFLKRYDALVFSGGGAKGLAHVGAAAYLKRSGYLCHTRHFVGTSIGAVVAATLAARMDPEALFVQHMLHYQHAKNVDISLLDQSFGIDTGAGLTAWLTTLFPDDPTFADLHRRHGTTLVVVVTNLNTRSAEYLSKDTSPDLKIVKALRMSCSVPLFFAAVKHNGSLYCDGAVCDNFAFEYTSKKLSKRVMGFRFKAHAKPPASKWCIDTFLGAVLEASVNADAIDAGPGQVLSLDAGETTQPLNFRITPGERTKLYAAGYAQCAAHFKKVQ